MDGFGCQYCAPRARGFVPPTREFRLRLSPSDLCPDCHDRMALKVQETPSTRNNTGAARAVEHDADLLFIGSSLAGFNCDLIWLTDRTNLAPADWRSRH